MAFNVADLTRHQPDSGGVIVEQIYIKIDGLYAVYRTDERVVIQFADDPALGAEQRKSLSELYVTRGAIDSLLADMRDTRDANRLARTRRYERRLADALTLGLQGQTNQAGAELERLKQDLIDERTSLARLNYLLAALATGAGLILLIAILSSPLLNFGVPRANRAAAASMWYAAAVGTVGAFFWTALAIRNKELEAGLSPRDTFVDAALRLLVGALSGALIYALIKAGAFGMTIGGAQIAATPEFTSNGPGWLLVLLVAFVAGFTQSLVPNMLAKTAATEAKPAKAISTRSAAEDARSSERNPLGDGLAAGPPGAGAAGPAEPKEEEPADAAEDADEDDCCDRPGTPELLTQDVELPAAVGGVEETRAAA